MERAYDYTLLQTIYLSKMNTINMTSQEYRSANPMAISPDMTADEVISQMQMLATAIGGGKP